MASCLDDESFRARQWTGDDTDAVSCTIKGFALDLPGLAKREANPFDLIFRYEYRLPIKFHKPHNTGRLKDFHLPPKVSAHEEISPEERFLNDLLAVAPRMLLFDEREK